MSEIEAQVLNQAIEATEAATGSTATEAGVGKGYWLGDEWVAEVAAPTPAPTTQEQGEGGNPTERFRQGVLRVLRERGIDSEERARTEGSQCSVVVKWITGCVSQSKAKAEGLVPKTLHGIFVSMATKGLIGIAYRPGSNVEFYYVK